MRKRKQSPRKRLSAAAWTVFSKFIRVRDAILSTGDIDYFKCISCRKTVPVKGNDAGHFVSGRSDAVLFDIYVVNGQCAHCNRFKEGEYILQERSLRKIYGFARVEKFKLKKWEHMKYTLDELQEIRDDYAEKTKQIMTWHNSGKPGLPPGVDERTF